MKRSLFEEQTARELIDRINKLQNASSPLWGKMNVAQMFAHCNVSFDTALSKRGVKDQSNFIFRTLVKWVALSERPYSKGLPTGKDFLITESRDIKEERDKLIRNVEEARLHNVHGSWKPHPAFGKLTPQEWGWFLFKHTDHHLRQFGV